ncbi:MAG TPA: GTPase ObgE [Salinivirga sp.]|uniref:GTPase ObgE n=1 Tax=Salinivirga sp. TaxID=1970192 RepID=UPI002B499695|nr:GTPase ObgE [Salinivirga sp.]HKK58669.1 GTPase ObgE [Salinivirga sp.]
MGQSNFVDYIRIFCRSGKGGAGSEHFRREKFVPKGGPDGGDGGRGGNIYLRGNQNQWTLLHLRYKKHIFAGDGQPGGGQRSFGAQGEDVIIDVPIGTIVRDEETNELICEVTKHDEKVVLLEGGQGGLGNTHFKTSTNQAPHHAQPGKPGMEGWFVFELKVLADIGLVGFPNAGKSTLLSVVSAAKPKIADYAFTTLTPNLGIVPYRDNRSFVMADIPGIIEGAAEGKGLGLRFLRHIERNPALLFMVPADSDDIHNEYKILLSELEKHNPQLLDKSRILAITKSDMLDEELIEEISEDLPDIPVLFISSVAQMNLDKLKDLIWNTLNFEEDV